MAVRFSHSLLQRMVDALEASVRHSADAEWVRSLIVPDVTYIQNLSATDRARIGRLRNEIMETNPEYLRDLPDTPPRRYLTEDDAMVDNPLHRDSTTDEKLDLSTWTTDDAPDGLECEGDQLVYGLYSAYRQERERLGLDYHMDLNLYRDGFFTARKFKRRDETEQSSKARGADNTSNTPAQRQRQAREDVFNWGTGHMV